MRTALFLMLAACSTSTEAPAPDAADAAHEEPVAEAANGPEYRHFGAEFTVDESVALSALLDDPSAFTGHTIRTEGRIADVCQQAGCWLVLADGERTIRITTKNHEYGVDRDTTSMWAELEGTVIERTLDPERTAHLRSEAANPDAMPENNVDSNVIYEFDATAVRIRPNS